MDGAGPSSNHTEQWVNGQAGQARLQPQQQQQQQQQQHSRPGVTATLEFRNPRMEAAYQLYMCKMQRAADLCAGVVNLFAVLVAYSKQHLLPSSQPASLLYAVSGSQSLALLLLLLVYPSTYARHRGVIVGCTRMYRLVVWLLYLREPFSPRLFRDNLSLRLFLLSPASGSVWLVLFYPLPMSLQLMLLGLSSFVAVARTNSLELRLQQLEASPERLAQTYQRLSRFSRFLEWPTGRLLQRWPGAEPNEADRLWCMYAFVTLVYGLLLPLLLLYVKEVHFRVRFLSCLRPAVSEAHLGRLRSSLYSTTTSACFLFVTLVPCAWSLVQLAARYLVVGAATAAATGAIGTATIAAATLSPDGAIGTAAISAGAGAAISAGAIGGRLRLEGVLFLLTVLSLEVFMRFWLLAVLQLLLHRVVRPALLWLLLRWTGQGQAGPEAIRGAGAGARQGAAAAGAGVGTPEGAAASVVRRQAAASRQQGVGGSRG